MPKPTRVLSPEDYYYLYTVDDAGKVADWAQRLHALPDAWKVTHPDWDGLYWAYFRWAGHEPVNVLLGPVRPLV